MLQFCSTRALLFGVVLLTLSTPSFGAGGEDCSTATLIPALPFTDTGDTCGALDDYNESCPFLPTGGRDLVYRITPATDLVLDIDLCTSDFDTKVYVYSGGCPGTPGSALIGCNDDFCGVNNWRSKLTVPVTAGVETYIVIDGYGAADCGSYEVSIGEFVAVPSDVCDTAETITIPFSGVISNVGATDDYNESCPFTETGGRDVVRRFIPTEDETLEVELCASDYDTKVYVYEGSCPAPGSSIGPAGSGTAIACDDDTCGENGFRSFLTVDVVAGQEYFLVIDAWGASDSGSALVTIEPSFAAGSVPCDQATEIDALPFVTSGVTTGITRFEHSCQFIFDGAPEDFFRYTATQDVWLEVDSCGSDFDTELTVMTGDCPIPSVPDASQLITCNDDGCGVDATRARIDAVFVAAGETITIVVDGHTVGDEGAYTLALRETCAPDYPSELSSLIDVGTRPIGTAMHEPTGRLFVANYGSGTISVIDTATDTVEATLPTDAGPYRLAITPDHSRLYVVCFLADTIACFDPFTLAPIATFPALGTSPLGLSFSLDSSALFVATAGDGRVTKWSIPGHQVLGEATGLGSPREVMTDPSGGYVYVSDPTGVRVWRVHTETLAADSLAVDEFPQALAFAQNGQYLLVGNFGFDRSLDHASVIGLHAWELVARLRIGTGPEEMVPIPGTPYLAVTNWGFSHHPNSPGPMELGSALGNVAIVRLPDFNQVGDPLSPPMIDAIETIVPAGGDYTFGIAVTPDGQKIYALHSGYPFPGAVADTVAVIDFPGGVIAGQFLRGDANADGAVDIADPVAILGFLFTGGSLSCENAGDANDDETLDIADPIALLGHLFAGGGALPPPTVCAADGTEGRICCELGPCP